MGQRATTKLLSASLLLAISSGFYLYLAFHILHTTPNIPLCIAFSLLVYAVYTFDRTSGGEEDTVNRQNLTTANKTIPIIAITLTLLIATAILIHNTIIPIGAIIPFAIGYLYTKGIPLGTRTITLKGGLGIKNIIVGLTWAAAAIAFLYPYTTLLTATTLFTYFATKLGINTVIYDYRDITGDAKAGIHTLPVHLGKTRTRNTLHLLNIALHVTLGTTTLLGTTNFPLTILIPSGIIGTLYIHTFSNETKTILRDLIVDGEWILISITLYIAQQASLPL